MSSMKEWEVPVVEILDLNETKGGEVSKTFESTGGLAS